jgi:transcriptional regulator with PAS, ATPase and Fis domain
VTIPPLKERKEDIKPIVEFYIKKYTGYDKPYDAEIIELYKKYDWAEGNVRELRDATRYMCQKAREQETITMEAVNSDYFSKDADVGNLCGGAVWKEVSEQVLESGYDSFMSGFERGILEFMAGNNDGVKTLAENMKLSEATLYRKLKKHGLKG